ncbi:MAG: glucokinase, partial [Bdellovibrionales bacterium]|nr:glucokinase [Bdellovibrionales bacterium]
MSQYIIIGDLGGTKCAFSFFELSSTNKISSLGMEPVVLPIRSYASFCELMEAANEQLPTTRKIEGASGVCIGAAGVWDSNTQNIYLEHYWNGAADIGEMLSRFSVAPEKVLILNDFEAEAHCLLTSIVDKRKIIRQGHGTYPTERFLLIGPGTGLGVAVIDRDGSLR